MTKDQQHPLWKEEPAFTYTDNSWMSKDFELAFAQESITIFNSKGDFALLVWYHIILDLVDFTTSIYFSSSAISSPCAGGSNDAGHSLFDLI